ncbi:MAG TPA: hypothetical protein EYM84_10240 [Flavobacteriales bacterium]|nr:hypothetical protein [Flavobacteriales bacterium]HIN40640.1 hypothetical protein [Flavobacteriales bacterium]
MSFLYPGFLFALFAIAIPIIIHLFNFRKYKTVRFTNVRFLKEIKQQTQAKSKLKYLLVLATRILAISFLVFAFAQPYFPEKTKKVVLTDNLASIYLDNSFSMEATNSQGRLFDQAKNQAIEIAKSYKQTDRFQLLTNDFKGKHQRLVNQEEFIELVENIEISSRVKSISEVIGRQNDALSTESKEGKRSFLISDFQRSNTNFEEIDPDSAIAYTMVSLSSQSRNNLYIDSCWFETPIRPLNQADKIMVRIRNISDEEYENIPLKLMINNQQKALGSCSVEPKSYTDASLSFTINEPGIINMEVSLSDYPITFDDQFFINYSIADHLMVLSIDDSTKSYTEALYQNDPYFEYESVNFQEVDYSTISEKHLIILNGLTEISTGLGGELMKFLSSGGSLIIFPNSDVDLDSYQHFLNDRLSIDYFKKQDTVQTKIDKINLDHLVFADVFDKVPENINLPEVYMHYLIQSDNPAEKNDLLLMQNGASFLSQYNVQNGKVYLFTSPLDEEASRFPLHALFVPIMYKIAINSQSTSNIFHTIGKNQTITAPQTAYKLDNEISYHLVNNSNSKEDKEFDLIPEARQVANKTELVLHDNLNKAGNYILTSGSYLLKGYAFNYNRKESDLLCMSNEEISDAIEEFGLNNFNLVSSDNLKTGYSAASINEDQELWKLCIIFALAFLGIETYLLRRWR